jgi:hypothetical protein
MPLTLDETDGFLEITTKPAHEGAEPQTVHLDVFLANNIFAALCEEHGDSVERGAAWVKWLAERGLNVSHGTAYRIAQALMEAVSAFKKKHGMAADSPNFASSDSSDSPSPE